ncbi:hypothetical protein [Cupriavidus basilensis]|nr:hypothetical protein [Cupriavidus basilensis]MDF3881854.1 hypothetical protein [Cupriavidus basilensis]
MSQELAEAAERRSLREIDQERTLRRKVEQGADNSWRRGLVSTSK